MVERLGIRVRRLRKLRGWSMQTLADHIGVKKETIYNLERGKTSTIRNIEGLAKIFEISVLELVTGTDVETDYAAIEAKITHLKEIDPNAGKVLKEHIRLLLDDFQKMLRSTIEANEKGFLKFAPRVGWNSVEMGRKIIRVLDILEIPADQHAQIIDELEESLIRQDDANAVLSDPRIKFGDDPTAYKQFRGAASSSDAAKAADERKKRKRKGEE